MRPRTLLVSLALACCGMAFAQDYPNRPIIFVLPAPPGGATDVVARLMAEEMGKAMKQTFVVDNKPGGGGMLGAQAVARAAPDGYTLLLTHTAPIMYVQHLFAKVPYDTRRDFTFITDICLNAIAYKGEAPMVQDMLAGQIPVAMATLGTAGPHVASGKLRALAVMGEQRFASLPEVPTAAQAGFADPEYVSVGGLHLLAPAGTPPAVLARLEKEARAAIQTTGLRARFQVYGLVPVGNSATDAARGYEAKQPVIQKLVRVSGAKVG